MQGLCACAVLSHFSRVRLCVTPWAVARQAPLSMRFPRQEYWRGWPFPSPGDLPDPGIKPTSSALQADSLPLSHRVNPGQQQWGVSNLQMQKVLGSHPRSASGEGGADG